MLKIGITAGEVSSDLLGARLYDALKAFSPSIESAGVGGEYLSLKNYKKIADVKALSMLGLIEPLLHIPRLIHLKNNLVNFYQAWKPEAVVGVDSGDFNIPLLKSLRKKNFKTFQFVSPQVWAWRQYRVHTIREAVEKVFCLFPFEKNFYEAFEVNSEFVGHPMADEIPLGGYSQIEAQQQLHLNSKKIWLAVLPGSRRATFMRLLPLFMDAVLLLAKKFPEIGVVFALTDKSFLPYFHRIKGIKDFNLPFQVVLNNMRTAVSACELALCPTGTSALEIMFLNKPMVVANKASWLGYQIGKRLIHLKYLSLPNLLANEEIVPELLQHNATPRNIADQLTHFLRGNQNILLMKETFQLQHVALKKGAVIKTACSIMEAIYEDSRR